MTGYSLGIDLGTTYSAAAITRDGRTAIVELGSRSASIPSVVFLRDDESILVGDAATRRAATEPDRVAREFKRRIGDPTPLLLGGASYSAEALTARLLRSIVDQVVDREGGWPDSIAITHPANWGPYKIDLLSQATRLAGVDDGRATVTLTTEPEAAVRHYATNERVESGSVLAVYDLGGGTFDAALLRKTDDADGTAFEPLGRPEGIERLGGIDFDAAVLGHVVRSLDGLVEALDDEEPGTLQALSRLRHECVEAKEALSSDTETSIPVLLPNVQTEVRLTRAEFEAMIRPSLADSIAAMQRAMSSAGVSADDVSAVLLVGGSSRVPLVAQLVSNEFGRPVAIDADPKHAIALGAAIVAAEQATDELTPSTLDAENDPGVAGHPVATGGVPAGAADESTPQSPSAHVDAPDTVASPADAAHLPDADVAGAPTSAGGSASGGRSRTPVYAGIAAAVAALAVTGAIVLSGSGGGDSPEAGAAATTAAETDEPAAEIADDDANDDTIDVATTAASTEGPTTRVDDSDPDELETDAEPPADTDATPESTDAPTTVAPTTTIDPATLPTECPIGPPAVACITELSVDDAGGLVAGYETFGFTPELEPTSDHLHFYFDSVIGGDEINAGSAGSGGDWRLWDAPNPFTATGGEQGRTGYTVDDARVLGANSLCVLVADVDHAVYPGTGNCIAIPEL